MIAYLNVLAKAMYNKTGTKGTLKKPSAIVKGSPIIGTHERSAVPAPYF